MQGGLPCSWLGWTPICIWCCSGPLPMSANLVVTLVLLRSSCWFLNFFESFWISQFYPILPHLGLLLSHQTLHNLLGGDESVNMAQSQSIRWPEQLDPRDSDRVPGGGGRGAVVFVAIGGGGFGGGWGGSGGRWWFTSGGGGGGGVTDGSSDEEGNIVTRVHLHDITSRNRPVEILNLPRWVLDYQGCCIYGLAVPHLSLSLSPD